MKIENIKMKFGKYKGFKLKDIPNNYLKFLYDKNISKGTLRYYTQIKLDLPKQKYIVEVKNSVSGDGMYEVMAWTKKDAIREVRRKHSIQVTQSFDGTEFSVHVV